MGKLAGPKGETAFHAKNFGLYPKSQRKNFKKGSDVAEYML